MDAGAFLQVCISSHVHYIIVQTFISRRISPFPHVKKYYVNLEAMIELFAMPGGDLIIKEIWKHRRAGRRSLIIRRRRNLGGETLSHIELAVEFSCLKKIGLAT